MTQQNNETWEMETLLVHGNAHLHSPKTTGMPTVQPIYTSTTYLHHDAATLEQAFNGTLPDDASPFVYARQGNPNSAALEEVISKAEHGIGAVTFGSGMAAIHAALLAAGLAPGKKIVVAKDLYGATINVLRKMFVPLGVQVVSHDLCCPHAAEVIRTEEPDVVYVETLSNPLVKVTDLAAISCAAKDVGATTIVDSTFTTPYLVRPIEHGFDIVVHSATKYLGGHGDSTAGVAITGQESLLEPLRNYAMMLGAMLSPFETNLVMRGLKTLAIRMERHCSNALQVAHFLNEHPAVARVHYPGLPSHPQHALASRLLSHERYGGLLSFELHPQSQEAAYRFMDSLKLCLHATTLGDVYSLVSYPPMSSHRNLSEAERHAIGITAGCIRLSVGIENIEDIINDLDQALNIL